MNRLTVAIAAIAFCLFATPVLADDPSGTQAVAQASAAGTVTGTVKDDGGVPIAGASVSLAGATNYSAQSDASGAFSIAGVAPGLYRLVVAKPGYQTAS